MFTLNGHFGVSSRGITCYSRLQGEGVDMFISN